MHQSSGIIGGVFSLLAQLLLGSVFSYLNAPLVWVFTFCLWLVLWVGFEVLVLRRRHNSFPRILTHLRYGPTVVLVTFICAVVFTDNAMIIRSRWEIHRYIYGNESPAVEKSFNLYSDYRGWCGNGYAPSIDALYSDAAAEGLDSTDPAVRGRSLRAIARVFYGQHRPTLSERMERARNDPDPIIREIAAEYRRDAGIDK